MRVTARPAVLLLALTLTGCFADPVAISTLPPASIPITDLSSAQPLSPDRTAAPTRQPTAEPTQAPATPAAPTPTASVVPTPSGTPSAPSPVPTPEATPLFGLPADDCRDGWIRPIAGTAEYEDALEILGSQMGVTGAWTVDEMRFFTGPDVPFTEPAYDPVERWYVKASLVDDPSFRARWILERRTDLIQGISAVASYESAGFESPGWTGFVGEGEPISYFGLPGLWSGVPYDFVTGEGDSGNPGLPDEVIGCLSGT